MIDLASEIRSLRGPIIVTGAAGFIGANLVKTLLAERADVYAAIKGTNCWRLADITRQNLFDVDLNDDIATMHLLDILSPQTIFDCAAYGSYSFEADARLIYKTNFTSVVRLVNMLMARPFSAYIHAGSSSEYGSNSAAPSESAACLPNSDYAVSKLAASEYLRFTGASRNFPCLTLRLYSVYGPLEDTSRLIPALLRSAMHGRLPPLVDPEISRDFVHVDDVCVAFILAAAKINPELYGEIINIGTGVKTTIGEIAALSSRLFSLSDEPAFGAMQNRRWDLVDWYCDPSKARETIGWEPSIRLEDGLISTAAWVKSLDDDTFNVIANKTARKPRRSLSVVIACYKDDKAIPTMHERLTKTLRKLSVDYELIFVNDCSPDATAEILRGLSAADSHVVGISHSRNFGSQMAFRSGMELSTKDGVVLLDGDLQDPPELIEQFYEKWDSGFEVVYGRRIKRDMPLIIGLFYKLFYRVFAAFSYIKVPLDAGDFSLIDGRVVQWLLNCRERDLFLRGLRAYVGFRQTGVDYVRPERAFGRSTNSFFRNIAWAKKGIFAFSDTPLTMLTMVGSICLLASLLLSLVQVLLRIFVPSLVPPGITTVLLAILIFGSLNLFALGLVGEYVAKIIVEVKKRPPLIRSALIRNGETTELHSLSTRSQ